MSALVRLDAAEAERDDAIARALAAEVVALGYRERAERAEKALAEMHGQAERAARERDEAMDTAVEAKARWDRERAAVLATADRWAEVPGGGLGDTGQMLRACASDVRKALGVTE